MTKIQNIIDKFSRFTATFFIFATQSVKMSTADLLMTTMKVIVLSILMVGVAILLLGVKVLFIKGSKFPSGHAHDNAGLRRRGVGCHHDDAR